MGKRPSSSLWEDFVEAALRADREIEAGGEVYPAEIVHAWLAEVATGSAGPTKPDE